MKKIKLELVVEDKDAIGTLTSLQGLTINKDIAFYVLCMEDCDDY